jgi:ComF family protein
MRSRIYKAGWKILDMLFPPSCAGCGSWGKKYCAECLARTRTIKKPICQICGDPLHSHQEVICLRCRTTQVAFSAVRSWAYFEDPLQSAIHKLKYRRDIGLASELSGHLVRMLEELGWQVNLITALPLDETRRKERGYNQAALLAKPISWETGIRYVPDSVVRYRRTQSQVGLTREDRVSNMAGAFRANRELVDQKSILLIDDVITTGSTMNACSEALMAAGASSVYGLTLARSAHI